MKRVSLWGRGKCSNNPATTARDEWIVLGSTLFTVAISIFVVLTS